MNSLCLSVLVARDFSRKGTKTRRITKQLGNRMKLFSLYITAIIILFTFSGCNSKPGSDVSSSEIQSVIEPDYSGVTIPLNIAPMNFIVKEKGDRFYAEISDGSKNVINIKSKNGLIKIPPKKWKNLLKTDKPKNLSINIFVKQRESGWKKYRQITNKISPEPVDPFLTYRLIYPGYESWSEISIDQRSLESFGEWHIIKNSVADENCVNCHSFNNGKSDDFLFHMRGSMGGTYFFSDEEVRKINLKTKEMKNGAVYPRWHPSGKFVAFSSNKIVQQFHSADNKKVEVTDLESSLVLYDIKKNEMVPVIFPDMEKYMDTYPEWSPDGNYIYFCRAARVADTFEYSQIRYNLMRSAFNRETRKFVLPETIWDASAINKSISFPRVSPDGKYLVVTLHDYGCFPIWHKEADLWLMDLETRQTERLSLNSDFTESYHSWSSNGRWMVFSSRRDDGLATRLYISYIDETGKSGKPFILPGRDPRFYDRFLKSYNVPEFSKTIIDPIPGKMRKISGSAAIQAGWSAN
jgi:hypothetical protein